MLVEERIVDEVVRLLARPETSAQSTPELRRLVAIKEVKPLARIVVWAAVSCGSHFTKRPHCVRLERR